MAKTAVVSDGDGRHDLLKKGCCCEEDDGKIKKSEKLMQRNGPEDGSTVPRAKKKS